MIKSDQQDNKCLKYQTIYKIDKEIINKNNLMNYKFIKDHLSNNRRSF